MYLTERAELTSAEINDLPDSAFAYIEPGGEKDGEGKTTPRKLRHYPIQDKAHVQNALARASAEIKDDGPGKEIAEKAMPAIKAAAEKFDSQHSATPDAETRSPDKKVAKSLAKAHEALANAKLEQAKDPDASSDPNDSDVAGEIKKADQALTAAVAAQAKDMSEDDPEGDKRNFPVAKRAFSSLIEQPPPHVFTAEIRSDDGSHIAHFSGYASTTGVPYSVRDWLGEYTETINPGAFGKTLREQSDVPMLFNHDGIPLASTGSGTMRVSEDHRGLRNEADLDTRDANTHSIVIQLARGVLRKQSFSFSAVKETWNDTYDTRGVDEARLYDTSIVTYPANDTAEGGLVDAFRSALGREGRSLWLAETEVSVRGLVAAESDLDSDANDLLERAVRALVHADEEMVRSYGPQGRARTFVVAGALLSLRAGKVLSSKHHALLSDAVKALAASDNAHVKAAQHNAQALSKVQSVLDASSKSATDGMGQGTPPGNDNPIMPQDGAGPRSLNPHQLQRQREREVAQIRRR